MLVFTGCCAERRANFSKRNIIMVFFEVGVVMAWQESRALGRNMCCDEHQNAIRGSSDRRTACGLTFLISVSDTFLWFVQNYRPHSLKAQSSRK